jgi:SAM-dependent methyltransferase
MRPAVSGLEPRPTRGRHPDGSRGASIHALPENTSARLELKQRVLAAARRLLSVETRRAIVRYTRWPPVGLVRFGSLRRLEPISRVFGTERGQPVDRYYIEAFLAAHAADVRGHVLEVGSDTYTRAYGGDRVTRSDVLHVAERRPGVTLVGDLARPDDFAAAQYDCVILTQTLGLIFDVAAAVTTVHRILRPGGVALVTVPGISQISRYDMDRWGHYWSFTTRSAQRLFEARFPADCIHVVSYGNVLTAVAMLHGVAANELRRRELRHVDADYQLVITIRALKPPAAP